MNKEQLYRWVKANERKSGNKITVCVKNRGNLCFNAYYDERIMAYFTNDHLRFAVDNIEWLEEVEPLSGDAEKDKEIEELKGLLRYCRTYFSVNDKTPMQHDLFFRINKILE